MLFRPSCDHGYGFLMRDIPTGTIPHLLTDGFQVPFRDSSPVEVPTTVLFEVQDLLRHVLTHLTLCPPIRILCPEIGLSG